jgi:small GTP-binding protein
METKMADDMELIKQLEKEIGGKLKQVEFDGLWRDKVFSMNKNGNVNGLNLDNMKLQKIPLIITKFHHLKKLSLNRNKISDISMLKELGNLTLLNLRNNQISDISMLKELRNLTRLDLKNNQISDISMLKELGNLTRLHLGRNQIIDISNLKELGNLNYLDLSSNQISDISMLKELGNLNYLDLRKNQISDISMLKKLLYLTRLDLRNNKISDISMLKELGNLTHLYLRNNKINDISILKELGNLTHLYLRNNKINDISILKELGNLTRLDLKNNQISDISILKELRNLNRIDLRNNEITELPEEILELPIEINWEWESSGGIFLEDNPLEFPPIEIVKKGKEAIKNYFQSLAGEKQALNEVKVLLVGDGGAGKTSLVRRLLEQGFDQNEPQTHGIKINPWNINVNNIDIKVHLWDFGGQEIMHATHQFFLSKRSLYILVLDGRKDEKTEYWLKHIESFGGDSPVLVVINKIDENPSFDVNRRFLLDKYKNIKGFYRISCAKNKGVKEFSRVLENELAQVDLIQTTWPKTWFNIKTQLEQMTEHFINYDQYKKMCEAEKIISAKTRETLVDFLNDLGVILHFKDFELEDTHVLEPKWVTEAVYKIINSEKLSQCKGVLNLKLLDHILQKKTGADYDYPRNKYKYIITLMKKFELCYGIDDKTVLIPDLLEVQEPPFDFDFDSSLKFILQYEFLPRSVMPRLIVNMHKDIKGELRWRTGVVLEDKEFQSIALVKADHEARRFYIYVNGVQKRDYFAAILVTLRRINRSFEKLKTTELVPMPDDPGSTVSYKHLIRLEKRGIDVYLPGDSEKEYKVKDLLGTIAPAKATEEEILQLLRKIKSDTDTFESLFKKANDIAMLQPNFMGLGINLNNLIQKILPKKGSKKKKSSREAVRE